MAVALDAGAMAEKALFYRLRDDAVLAGLLGSGARVFTGWPTDSMTAADFPRITLTIPSDVAVAPGFHDVRIQTDTWVWPEGLYTTPGGDLISPNERLLAIKSRINEILNPGIWTFQGVRMNSVGLGGQRPVRDQLLRAMQEFEIGAN